MALILDHNNGVADDNRLENLRIVCQQLLAELGATNWSAVGRKYGVSDNAVRKWVRVYERERAVSSGEAPSGE